MERQLYPKDGHASGCAGGVEDEELAELAKKVAMVLTKKSLKTAATVLRPDVERLDQSTGVIMTKRRKKWKKKRFDTLIHLRD
ncbi:lambda phage CII family protein [Escherichia coli]|nr:lambda phage CII family protein [Escherichia coli]